MKSTLFRWMRLGPLLLGPLCVATPLVLAQEPVAPGVSRLVSPAVAIETQKLEWFDAKRGRVIPAKLHFPKTGAGLPLIVISHGMGGTRDNLDYFGTFWASHGYVCAQIQHAGSDQSVWRGAARPMAALKAATSDPAVINARPADVKFAIDTLLQLSAEPKSPLFGRIDAAKIGAAGHSFGAFTAQAVAGRGATYRPEWRDPRVSASIALSAPAQSLEKSREQYRAFKTPFYVLTGTLDDSPLGDTRAADRRAPFDAITGVEGYFLSINGADHATFGGRLREDVANDARDRAWILESTLLFWNAYLKGATDAKTSLRGGEFARKVGAHGSFEIK